MADDKLSLNVLKTDFIIVGTRSKMRDLEETLCITVQNESIYRAPFLKSLGLFIDENLDWENHVSDVLKKVSSGLLILKMSKNYLPQGTLKILYNFNRDPFPLWQYYLGELREDIFNKASEITTPGGTNNYWFGLRYSSRTFNRTTRVENSQGTDTE